MLSSHSIRSFIFLPYFLLLFTIGCSQKATKHVYVEVTPSVAINHSLNNASIQDAVDIKPTSVEIKPDETPVVQIIEPKNNWERLVSLYAFPDIDNARIDKELQIFLKNPDYLTKIQHRAAPYLHFILDQIEAKQLPGELALLPAIESSFKPNAHSRSHAVGLWQFIPATGRLFGLEQNWWYDGRKDIYHSTQAATNYLKQLATLYNGDWPLALASYNAGKGYISKAIHRNKRNNKPTDYWSLSLYRETMDYVPKLFALAKIFANPSQYHLSLIDLPIQPYFSVIDVKGPFDLRIAAQMADTPLKEFINLNPGFKRSIIRNKKSYKILVEKEKAEQFNKKFVSTSLLHKVGSAVKHKIRYGENLITIAKKYHTSVYALRQSNQLSSSKIRAGQYLLIPDNPIKKPISTAKRKIDKRLYTVKKGDTFWEIAKQFSVKRRDLASWNNLTLSTTLYPGQKLIIEES